MPPTTVTSADSAGSGAAAAPADRKPGGPEAAAPAESKGAAARGGPVGGERAAAAAGTATEAGEGGAAAAPGAQDKTRAALQAQTARKDAAAGRQQVAPGPAGSNADKLGAAAEPIKPVHPRKADLDADRASLRRVGSFAEYESLVTSLRVVATEQSKVDVRLRVGKLMAALTRSRAYLLQAYGPAKGAELVKQFYDDPLAGLEAGLADRYLPQAADAATKIEEAGNVQASHQWNAARALVDYKHMQPEELVSDEVMSDSAGVMKVFDVGQLFDASMSPSTRDAWNSRGGGQAGFVAACRAAGTLVALPPQAVASPAGSAAVSAGDGGAAAAEPAKTLAEHFPKQHFGFVGVGKDYAKATSFEEAIVHFQLAREYYPSATMLACHTPADVVKSMMPKLKIGKPSIFYLLAFNENTYQEQDRVFGHLADKDDPSKPGEALELQVQGLPYELLLEGAKVLS
jgi:hypothetical protein